MSEAIKKIDDPGSRAVRDANGRLLPGHSMGRPRGVVEVGARNFLADVTASWLKHGERVLEQVAINSPETYLRVMASLVPRELLVRQMSPEKVIDADAARADVQRLLAQREQ